MTPATISSPLTPASETPLTDADDTQAVPAALTGLVHAAYRALRLLNVNPCYGPLDIVSSLEKTTAVLGR